jgi:hypothetical protein
MKWITMAIDWKQVLSTRPPNMREMLLSMQIAEGIKAGKLESETVLSTIELLISRSDGRVTIEQIYAADADEFETAISALGETFKASADLIKLSKQLQRDAG